jgi:hypothetical protein
MNVKINIYKKSNIIVVVCFGWPKQRMHEVRPAASSSIPPFEQGTRAFLSQGGTMDVSCFASMAGIKHGIKSTAPTNHEWIDKKRYAFNTSMNEWIKERIHI